MEPPVLPDEARACGPVAKIDIAASTRAKPAISARKPVAVRIKKSVLRKS